MAVDRRRLLIGVAASSAMLAVICSTAAQSAAAVATLEQGFQYAFANYLTRLNWGQTQGAAVRGALNTFMRNASAASWAEGIGKALPAVASTVGILSLAAYFITTNHGFQWFSHLFSTSATPPTTDILLANIPRNGSVTYSDSGTWYHGFYPFGSTVTLPDGFGLIGTWSDANGNIDALGFKPNDKSKYPPVPVTTPITGPTTLPGTVPASAAVDPQTLADIVNAALAAAGITAPPFVPTDFPPVPAGALVQPPAVPAPDVGSGTDSSTSASVSSSASASSSSSASASADTALELPSLPTVAEPPAWWDAWKGPLNSVVPTASQHGSACPVMSLQVPDQAWPRLTMKTQTFDQYCALGDQAKPTLRTIATAFAGISALITVLKA